MTWDHEEERRKRLASPEAKMIPARYVRMRLGNFDPDRSPSSRSALMEAKAFVANWPERRQDGQGLLIMGPVGTGKSHLAVGILQELAEVWGGFVDAKLLLSLMRSHFDGVESGGPEMLQAARRRRLLVLDDLVADDAKPSEWVIDTLGDIIRHRYNRCMPTIITTNRKIHSDNDEEPSLERFLGDPLVSRLIHMCKTVRLVARDKRREEDG